MQYGLKIRSHAVIVDFRLTKKLRAKVYSVLCGMFVLVSIVLEGRSRITDRTQSSRTLWRLWK